MLIIDFNHDEQGTGCFSFIDSINVSSVKKKKKHHIYLFSLLMESRALQSVYQDNTAPAPNGNSKKKKKKHQQKQHCTTTLFAI